MIIFEISPLSCFIYRVKALQSKVYHCDGVWRCCSYLKGNFIGMVQRHSKAVTPSHTPPQQHTLPSPTEDSRFETFAQTNEADTKNQGGCHATT